MESRRGSWQTLSASQLPRPESKRLTPVNSVYLKIGLIQGKDVAQAALFGQNDQGSIGQVHGSVLVFLHQRPHPATIFKALLGNFEIALFHQVPESILGWVAAGFTQQVHGLGESRPGRQHRTS